MRRKAEWLLKGIFLGLGILAVILPALVVKISGQTFSKMQTAFFLSTSLLFFQGFCVTQMVTDYRRDKKINVFFLCAAVLLLAVIVSVWL